MTYIHSYLVWDKYVLKENRDSNGYPQVRLNDQPQQKHRLIALQFIPNDDPLNKVEVHHINGDRNDYHIENLEWVTKSYNCKHRNYGKYKREYVDEISDDAIEVSNYGKHAFENYFYCDDEFYIYENDRNRYRILHINKKNKNDAEFVKLRDTNGKYVEVFYSKFKRLYGID